MKRINTKAEPFILELNGLKTRAWHKVCPVCHKSYDTTSRTQKYCSDSCSRKAQSKRKQYKAQYDSTKHIQRLSARSHNIAVEVMNQLIRYGLRENKCSCGCTSNLQVHHINGKWMDNSPSNLVLLCSTCHAKAHQEASKWSYDEEEMTLYSVLTK